MTDLTSRHTHFEFGENWAQFAQKLTDAHVRNAETSLRRLLPEGLRGMSFLDIGCGSGLSAVAAARLGAERIVACDIDENSVRTAELVLDKYALAVPRRVLLKSVFEIEAAVEGQFDVVHSWGVLHHTGDMRRAVASAAALVRPGGLFVVALYAKTPACSAWAWEKRLYSRAPRLVQRVVQVGFAAAKLPFEMVLSRRNPVAFVRDYHQHRGMNYWNDLHDWLGGYPYESATPADADAMVGAAFARERAFIVSSRTGLLGTGCSEFVYRRRS